METVERYPGKFFSGCAADVYHLLVRDLFKLPKQNSENLPKQNSEKIINQIEPSAQGKLKATKRFGSFISGQTRLAVSLRWLAGGSHLDISFAFGVSSENFFNAFGILWPTLEAIDRALMISFPLRTR